MDAPCNLPIALLFLALVAGESSGRPMEGTVEAGPWGVRTGLVVSGPLALPADERGESLWRVRPAQALLGVLGGTLGAVLGGAAGLMLVPPCTHEDEPEESTGLRAAQGGNCGAYGIVAGFAMGAIGGTSGGIYLVGRGSGGEGSYLATAGGATAGLVAGFLLAGSARADAGPTLAILAAATTLPGLAAYHFTDRVRLAAGRHGTSAQVVLARF